MISDTAWITLSQCDPNLRGVSDEGRRSSTGHNQRVLGDAGYWEVKYTEIAVMDATSARKYRAMLARLRAGEQILLPVPDPYAVDDYDGVPSSASFGADAALRATTATINVVGPVPLEAGMYFTVGQRLYVVSEVTTEPSSGPSFLPWWDGVSWDDDATWLDAGSSPGPSYVVTFLPPLRTAATSGDPISLTSLQVLAELKTATDGDVDFEIGRLGRPSLTFVESL